MMVVLASSKSGAAHGAGPHDEPSRLSRAARTSLLMVALLASFVTAGSCGHALGTPGPGDIEDKTAAWVRHQHLDPVVSLLESWVTGHHHRSRG